MAGTATSRGSPRQITQSRQAVPVIGAGEIPRIQFSNGSARALEAFSRDMFALSDQFQRQLDETAEAEATVEGAVSGATGQFELRDYATIRGRAYNKAAIETFASQMDTNSILAIQGLSQQYANDPVKLEKAIADWTNGAATEVGKIYPPAGIALRNRNAVRALPIIEAARDTRYKLTRDAADARLIENQVALKAEIKTIAGSLFSENPALSSAASQAVGALQADYLRIYEAVDDVTGKPLYSAEEKAKAKAAFYNEVMESGALGWFDQQKDKAGAYLKFTEGNFTINLKTAGGTPKFSGDPSQFLKQRLQAQHGPEHVDGMEPAMQDRLASFLRDAPPGIDILSGRRSTARQAQLFANSDRTGRTVARPGHSQHEKGNAADLGYKGGKFVNAPKDVQDWVHAHAAEYGLRFPMSYEGWHIETVEARGGKVPEPVSQSVDVRKALGDAAMQKIEAEMRARISFSNQMADRAVAQGEKELRTRQDVADFEMTNRLFSPDANPETGKQPRLLTRDEVTEAVRAGTISPDAGKAIVRALATDKPKVSDPAIYTDALRRVYDGENIKSFVLDNSDKLSPSDAAELLGKNQSLNVVGEGALSKDQQFHFDNLKDRLTPDGLLEKYDEGKQNRRYQALDEYRRRVAEGESARDVANDVAERATLDYNQIDRSKLGGMIRPRFSVKIEGQQRIDINASFKALEKNKANMTPGEFRNNMKLLSDWRDIQERLGDNPSPRGKQTP